MASPGAENLRVSAHRWQARMAGMMLLAVVVGACSFPEPPDGAIDLAYEDGRFVAVIDEGVDQLAVYESTDGGVTWTELDPSEFPSNRGDQTTSACLEGGECFRTENGPTPVWRVSSDGEEPAWSFPLGRHHFLERYEIYDFPNEYSTEPRDIVAAEGVVLVAMSNDGVLRGAPDGTWERGVVGDPFPLRKWGANIGTELTVSSLLAYLAIVLNAVRGRSRLTRLGVDRSRTGGGWQRLGWLSAFLVVPLVWLVHLAAGFESALGLLVVLALPGIAASFSFWNYRAHPIVDSAHPVNFAVLMVAPALVVGVIYLWYGSWGAGFLPAHWMPGVLSVLTALVWLRLTRDALDGLTVTRNVGERVEHS